MVSKDIKRVLTERGAVFNIILEDVSITNLTFSREYTAAVEAKQVRAEPFLPAACLACPWFRTATHASALRTLVPLHPVALPTPSQAPEYQQHLQG